MSAPATTRPKVPDGQTKYYVTSQNAPTDKGFVGYSIKWTSFQKEATYSTPKN